MSARHASAARPWRSLARLLLASLGLVGGLGILGTTAVASPALAASAVSQAGGADVPTWFPGASWSYDQVFTYSGNGDLITVDETVTYAVAGVTTYDGYSSYQLSISGTVTGGSGQASGYQMTVTGGSVSGVEYLRRSDLAMVYQHEVHDVNGNVLGAPVSVELHYTAVPSSPWRKEVFRLHPGDVWQLATSVAVSGYVDYQAPPGQSGSSPFSSTYSIDAPVSVSASSISVPYGQVQTYYLPAIGSGTSDKRWWDPAAGNVAEEHLRFPAAGGTVSIDRSLSAYQAGSTPAQLSESLAPSSSCAGGGVAVYGTLSSGGAPVSGASVSVALDQSALGSSDVTTKAATTDAQGNYEVSFAAPSQADGMQKAGVTGSWGIVASAQGTWAAATLEVLPGACSTQVPTKLAYTGPPGGGEGQPTVLSAALTDALTGAPVQGADLVFTVGSLSASATTGSSGQASATLDLSIRSGSYTLTISYAGSATLASASLSTPFVIGVPTSLAYTGPRSSPWGMPVSLAASLTNPASGQPVAGEPVSFSVAAMRTGAITNSAGVAEVSFFPDLSPGSYTMIVAFAGGDGFAPAVTSVAFQVEAHSTTLSYSGPSSATWGKTVRLTATLGDATAGGGIPGESISFSLGTQSVSAITDKNGVASATLTLAQTPSQATCSGGASSPDATCLRYAVVVSFSGSAHYRGSSDSMPFTIDWPYVFSDAGGLGTVYLSPGSKQFLFVAAAKSGPPEVFGPVSNVQMTTVTLPGGNGVTDVTYSSSVVGLQGEFSLADGAFSAVVDTATHLYVLASRGSMAGQPM